MITKISMIFDLYNNGTNIKAEVLAGVTAFLATMYIILVNPAILSEAELPFNAVLTATVLVSAFSSILMGLYAKNPRVVAPGMSINYLFAYTVVKVEGVPWETALGCVFWAGAIFLLLTVLDKKKADPGGGSADAPLRLCRRDRPLHRGSRLSVCGVCSPS